MNILRGIFAIASGRVRGLERFGAARSDFIFSLLVVMAALVLATLAIAIRRGIVAALSIALLLLCVSLAPPVIAHVMARFWGREMHWLRFATAFNWSRFALVGMFLVLLLLSNLLVISGMPNELVGSLLIYVMSIYSLWLEWFVARHTLQITNGRALLTVITINVATFLLLAIPGLIVRLLIADTPAG